MNKNQWGNATPEAVGRIVPHTRDVSSRPILAIALCVALGACGSTPSPAKPEARTVERELVLDRLADALEARYLFPTIGSRYARYCRSPQGREMYLQSDDTQFATDLTAALARVHVDAHLRVVPPSGEVTAAKQRHSSPIDVAALEASERLAPGVAYLRFNLFPSDPATLRAVREQLDQHAEVDTLIIDVRGHRGGGIAEMDLLFAELFALPTVLLHMDTRTAVERDESWPKPSSPTMRRIESPAGMVRREHVALPASPPRLANAAVYVLVSPYTASAAEHLALALKRTRRGVLVGEATRGGAHFGGTIDLGYGFAAFVPVGRTFDPDTGDDWEGVGVAPDVLVESRQALVTALVRAGVDQSNAEAIDRRLGFIPPSL